MNARATLHGERGPPPHFAGRDAELAAMRRRLDITLREPGAAMNGLLLITGIPGIGKTHLAVTSLAMRQRTIMSAFSLLAPSL